MTLYTLIGSLVLGLGANAALGQDPPEAPPLEAPPLEAPPPETISADAITPETITPEKSSPETTPLLSPDPSLEFTLLAGVYLPRLGGESALGGADISIDDQLNLDNSESVFNFELALRKGDNWEIQFGTLDFSTEATVAFAGTASFGGLSLSPGDPVSSTLDFDTFNLEVSPGLWRPYETGDTSFRFAPTFGMRWVGVDHAVTLIGTGTRVAEGEWLMPYVGLQLEIQHDPADWLPFARLIEIDAAFMTGPALGGDGGTMWQVRAGATIHLNDHLGISFGYRLIELDVEDNAFSFTGGLQGLFIGGSLRF